jgi:hypothetical protein
VTDGRIAEYCRVVFYVVWDGGVAVRRLDLWFLLDVQPSTKGGVNV